MKKLKFLVSLTTNDNDYQIEQAADAEAAAKRLGADIQIIYADNDSITQSQQILNVIQSRSESLPDGIVFEPVGGTALPQVARAAAVRRYRMGGLEPAMSNTLPRSAKLPRFQFSG